MHFFWVGGHCAAVNSIEWGNQTKAMNSAYSKGLGVEDFQALQKEKINRYSRYYGFGGFYPHRRFAAASHLEIACKKLSVWRNEDRKTRGEAELPVYKKLWFYER